MKGQRVAAFGYPYPRRSLAGECGLLAAEARLVADYGAGAALALQAVAHRDARRFALNRKVKLSAATGDASGGHGSAPWLSISVECRLDFKAMHYAAEARFAPASIESLEDHVPLDTDAATPLTLPAHR